MYILSGTINDIEKRLDKINDNSVYGESIREAIYTILTMLKIQESLLKEDNVSNISFNMNISNRRYTFFLKSTDIIRDNNYKDMFSVDIYDGISAKGYTLNLIYKKDNKLHIFSEKDEYLLNNPNILTSVNQKMYDILTGKNLNDMLWFLIDSILEEKGIVSYDTKKIEDILTAYK